MNPEQVKQGYVEIAIALLNHGRRLLETYAGDDDLKDAADDIGPVLLALEDWQRKQGGCNDATD